MAIIGDEDEYSSGDDGDGVVECGNDDDYDEDGYDSYDNDNVSAARQKGA